MLEAVYAAPSGTANGMNVANAERRRYVGDDSMRT